MTVASGLLPTVAGLGRRWRPTVAARDGIGNTAQAAVFLLGLVIVFSRLPGALLHPQFFAEDGWVWYQQAYNLGWLRSLILPQAGYLQTLPRLVAGLTLLLPMQWAPMVMNIAGAAIQVLPVNALLSERLVTWGPLRLRMLMAALYLTIPNAPEVHIVLTNAMWHLAVLQSLMAFAAPPSGWRGRMGDGLLFTLASISGPFSLLLLPCIAVYGWIRRQRWTSTVLCILLPGLVLQLLTMAHAVRAPGAPLGMSWLNLLRIVAGNIFVNSMTGGGGAYLSIPLLLVASAAGLFVILQGWRCARLALRLHTVFAILVLLASLHDPLLLADGTPRWVALSHVSGIRYWFLPSLMFLWSGACCAFEGKALPTRLAGGSVLLFSLLGITYKWTYPAWPSGDYAADVVRFKALKPGEHMFFPVYDPGGRPMELVKK